MCADEEGGLPLPPRPRNATFLIQTYSRHLSLGAGWLEAASTSSSFDALARSPRSQRFCSSVLSPIIRRWIMGRGSLVFFLASFGSDFSVSRNPSS